ncbi:hypothetical protein [Nocardia yunnanensis]|nr:hypothetical protein [Nocardia yunnanensis]
MFSIRATVLLVTSLAIGIAAGALTVANGQKLAAGVLAGGAAFAGAMVFLNKFVAV